jgi:hypothetical protein
MGKAALRVNRWEGGNRKGQIRWVPSFDEGLLPKLANIQ